MPRAPWPVAKRETRVQRCAMKPQNQIPTLPLGFGPSQRPGHWVIKSQRLSPIKTSFLYITLRFCIVFHALRHTSTTRQDKKQTFGSPSLPPSTLLPRTHVTLDVLSIFVVINTEASKSFN